MSYYIIKCLNIIYKSYAKHTICVLFFSDSNNQRLLLGDSAMIPVPGKGLLKPQGTVSSAKQLRFDQKK